jgi:hypothetical protein
MDARWMNNPISAGDTAQEALLGIVRSCCRFHSRLSVGDSIRSLVILVLSPFTFFTLFATPTLTFFELPFSHLTTFFVSSSRVTALGVNFSLSSLSLVISLLR